MKIEDLQKLEMYFAYRVEMLPNQYGYEITIWDTYSLSVTRQGKSFSEAFQKVIKDFADPKNRK